ncbi:peptidoglycan D,D-transpeptidase FtsI family protein [Niallia taxi]|uniref:serine-type D-Ala-D-Ala carboxypeptidase n=1 Tax=Niallia taxi TaxID=2499688 RepID=A0A3S3SLP6_9BACI|nr:penicillin-binding transpeptidase domain-containing protein [Niallia taxi]MCM3215278.1 penicillin-binding transpeptidase domain-containing protein [Niallia taxi]MDK8639579.1 penicillin-binding transpeptidase domain-containing protein [Niallia taxi]MED4037953.1 penicillin-binding transpeptidase domain-containing protein [Niallia taxi]MED4055835.1 penicillin-binding transpeptidase domain-containing protein [Niallia taxi]MED4117831.1 penicillin-binding transpeptidase domain-containing protein 
MWRNRAIFIGVFFICMLAVLLARLVQIQLIETEHFTKHNINLVEASVKQRSQEMVLDNGRGGFLDRDGESLTQQTKTVLILFPFLKNMEWDSKKIADIIGTTEYTLTKTIAEAKEPVVLGGSKPVELSSEQMTNINSLKIPGVFAVNKKYRVQNDLAEQLLGITGQNEEQLAARYPDKKLSYDTLMGLTGLEKSFDEFLLPDGESKLVYHVDATGGPLFGVNVKYVEPGNPFYPVNIKTTIDKELQENAEQLADKHGIKKGGLVLLDIETNTVAAMVSRPNINSSSPYETEGINNFMLKQQIVGSVFKTVVAAAAIDNKLDNNDAVYNCSQKINGDPDPVYQHGMLNFTDSFAVSCNNTFATIAKDLQNMDEHMLEDYANKLSLTASVGWQGSIFHSSDFKQIQDEEKGRVFLSEEARKDKNYVALTGIGQNEVRVTPLAVANMMATIARGGEKQAVRVASEIEYKNGSTLLTFDQKKLAGDTIKPYTAERLQKLLREVVENKEGTGRWFQDLPYEVAGKSGTAETGIYKGKEQLHNKWFAGYFPYDNPKYALVTVNLEVFADEGGVNPLFADMVKMVYEHDHNENKQE